MTSRRAFLYLMLASLAMLYVGCERNEARRLQVAGRIEGTFYSAGPLVGGRVIAVGVEEGDAVLEGARLLALDPDVARANLNAAEAQADRARATLRKLEAGATKEQRDQARAALRAAEAQYQLVIEGARPEERNQVSAQREAAAARLATARAERDRVRDLHKRLATSRQQVDQVEAAYEAARAQFETATEQMNMVTEGARANERQAAEAQRDRAAAALAEIQAGTRPEDLDAARAAVAAAQAQVEAARVQLTETEVIAPGAGVVQAVNVSVGDLVQPGPLVRILSNEDLELVVYVTARALGKLSVGQTLPVTTDAHGDHRFNGVIRFIAGEGAFTPRNLQTEEERAQQVFEVRLHLNNSDRPLHPGMSATLHLPNGKPAE